MRLCRERLACGQPVLEGGALPRDAVPYIADGLGRDVVPRCDDGGGVQAEEVVYLDGGEGVELRARAYFDGSTWQRSLVVPTLLDGPERIRGHEVRVAVAHIEDGARRDSVLASEGVVGEAGVALVDRDGFVVREVAA